MIKLEIQHGYNNVLLYLLHTGIRHQICINFSTCESEPVTLIRYGFWPAKPKRPCLAFSIHLLESAKVLLLDGINIPSLTRNWSFRNTVHRLVPNSVLFREVPTFCLHMLLCTSQYNAHFILFGINLTGISFFCVYFFFVQPEVLIDLITESIEAVNAGFRNGSCKGMVQSLMFIVREHGLCSNHRRNISM